MVPVCDIEKESKNAFDIYTVLKAINDTFLSHFTSQS